MIFALPLPGEQEAAAASWSLAAAGNYRLAPGLHRDKLITGVFVSMLELVESPAMIQAPVFFYFAGNRKLKIIPYLN